MADFAINVILRSKNEASPAVRQFMGDVRALERMGARGKKGGRGKRGGLLDLNPAGINETAGAFTQLGGAAKSAVGAPIELAANFEAAINRVNALSGGTLGAEGKLAAISTKARELGKSTEFTATQAADGFAVLTQAGFGYEQQLDSIGTVLDIATVAQIDMEQAANLTANAIGGFGLQAKDAARVGTTLVRASNASQISIQDLGESFKYAAPGASKLGFDIEEVGTAIAILGRSGLKGSMGGTALRAFFNRLSMATGDFATDKQKEAIKQLGMNKKDLKKAIESGDLKNVAVYMAETMKKSKLSSSGKIAAMQALFQERGALGAMILMQSAGLADEVEGSWGAMDKVVNDANVTLEKSAAIMRSGTKGSATVLKSALEELGITVGEKLLPVITPMITWATDMAVKFADWANEHPALIRGIGRMLIVTAALGTTLGPLILTLSSIKILLGSMSFMAPLAGRAFGKLGGSVGTAGSMLGKFRLAGIAAAAAMAAAAVVVGTLEGKIARLRAQTRELGGQVQTNEATLAGELSDEELKQREERLLGLSERERARVDAKQQEMDDEWGGAYSTILGVFGGSELNTADDTAAKTLESQYATVRDERIRREKEKAATIAAKAAPTLGESKNGKAQVLIDPESKIRIILEEGRAPRVEQLESGDIPLEVETGIVGGESY